MRGGGVSEGGYPLYGGRSTRRVDASHHPQLALTYRTSWPQLALTYRTSWPQLALTNPRSWDQALQLALTNINIWGMGGQRSFASRLYVFVRFRSMLEKFQSS